MSFTARDGTGTSVQMAATGDGSGTPYQLTHNSKVADGDNVAQGATTDAAASTDTSNVSQISLFKRLLQRLTVLIGQLPSALTGSGNLKAAIVEASATVNVSQQASTPVSGTLQSAATADGNGTPLSVSGMAAAVLTVAITGTATVNFEGTEDGSTWSALNSLKLGTNTLGTSTTSSGDFEVSCAGLQSIRARISGSSPTPSVTVTAHAVPVAGRPHVVNANIIGSTVTGAISVADGADTTFGAKADSEASTDTGTFTFIALFKHLLTKVTTLLGQLPSALTGSGNLKAAIVESSATVTVDSELPSAAALADAASSTPTTPTVGAEMLAVQGGDSTKIDRLRQDNAGALRVSLYGKQTNAGDTALAVDSSGRQTVNVNGTVTVDTELPAAAALADGASNPTTPMDGACLLVWNGATWDRLRAANTRKDQNAVAIGTIATVWTPASGKKFRLMGGQISVSAAANVLFEDNSGGNFIDRTPKLAADTPYNFDLGQGYLSSAANNVLKATSSASANLTGTLYGTEE